MTAAKKKKTEPNNWKTIHVRVSKEEYFALDFTAKENKRSTTKMAELLLSEKIKSDCY